MRPRPDLGVLAAAVALTTVVASLTAVEAADREIAVALLAGCVAAGAALCGGAGRPLLVAAALAGTGAYVSGGLVDHGVLVPVAVPLGTLAGALAGALVAAVGQRLDAVAFLLLGAVLAIAGGAAVQALPSLTGAERGLGPLLGLGVPIGGDRFAALTALGDLHLAAALLVVVVGGCALLDTAPLGAAWRAAGSDAARAERTGVGVVAAMVGTLALAGAVAGFAGALTAHIEGVASPSAFAIDTAALPLLAALASGNRPVAAALLAAATSVLGAVVLPEIGWQGPPSAPALALGALAVAAAAVMLRRRAHAGAAAWTVDPAAPWPFQRGFDGTALEVPPTRAHAGGDALILDAPALSVPPGACAALVGVNGAGKSTLLRRIEDGARDPGVVLLPQEGGGFASCTVAETLRLGARAGGDSHPAATARAWAERLGLGSRGGTRCADLSDGQRRLVDLARALLARPRVLLCDEPLAGLDGEGRDAVVSLLGAARERGLTLLVADHDRTALRRLTEAVTELQRPSAEPIPRWR
ncbi:MAG: ATP-binding cassette domain-containing protein [Candidatus Dormibacteria bacterium]